MKELEVIEAALNLATTKGCYTLADTSAILNALQGLAKALEHINDKPDVEFGEIVEE